MDIPDDVLLLIREFTRPISRPDWRNLRPMSSRKFHLSILETYYLSYIPVIETYITRYDQIQYSYVSCSTYQPILKLRVNY